MVFAGRSQNAFFALRQAWAPARPFEDISAIFILYGFEQAHCAPGGEIVMLGMRKLHSYVVR